MHELNGQKLNVAIDSNVEASSYGRSSFKIVNHKLKVMNQHVSVFVVAYALQILQQLLK